MSVPVASRRLIIIPLCVAPLSLNSHILYPLYPLVKLLVLLPCPLAAFIPLYCAIMRPHLEYAIKANSTTLRADINQRLATRLVSGLQHVPYEERLCQLNLFSLERRRLRTDLILAFKVPKGEVDLSPSDFFLRPPRAGLTGPTCRLLLGPSRFRRRSGVFSVRVVKYWNKLPAPLVLSPSVSIIKKKQLGRQWSEICSPSSTYCNPRLLMLPLPPNTD